MTTIMQLHPQSDLVIAEVLLPIQELQSKLDALIAYPDIPEWQITQLEESKKRLQEAINLIADMV